MSTRRDLRAVVWFLVLNFGLTWALWSTLWLPGLRKHALLMVSIMALGMWGPGLSALLVTRYVLGESWRTLSINRLGKKRYYLWAWFLPPAGTIVALGLTVALGVAHFDPFLTVVRDKMGASAASWSLTAIWIGVIGQAVLGMTVFPLINVLFAVGEEIGWRGFLLPRLIGAGLGQWRALALSGAIWGLWHAPVVIHHGHNYPDHPYLGVLLMTVFCTLLGVIIGWLQLASGSVWVPGIAHGALNATAGLPLLMLTAHDSALGGMLTSVIGWVPMCLFIGWLAWSGRLPDCSRHTPCAEGDLPCTACADYTEERLTQ